MMGGGGGRKSEQEYQLESAGAGVMTVLERWVVGMTFPSLFASSRTPVAVFRGLTAEFSATLVVVLVPLSSFSSSAHPSLNTKNQNCSFSTST
jgi:Ca2+/H+ antiporter